MKILKYVVALFVVLVAFVFILLFTGFGNSLVSSYLSSLAKDKAGIKVEFNKFDIGISDVDISATINDMVVANIGGDLSIFTQKMDLKYDINAKNLDKIGVSLNKPITITGLINGKFSDFNANATGKIAGSDLKFNANIKDYEPLALKLDAKGLRTSDLLALVAKPAYLNANIDVVADITQSNSMANGNAKLEIYNGLTNNELIKRDFNVTLPNNFSIKGAVKADINDNIAKLKSIFVTPIATLEASKTTFDISKNELNSDATLYVDDLSKFEPIINQKLKGSLNAIADVKVIDNKLENLNLVIKGLGGEVLANLKNNNLVADVNNIKIEQILALLSQPMLVSGDINAKANIANLDNLDKISGDVKLNSKNAKLLAKVLKQFGDLNFKKDIALSLNSDARIKSGVIDFDAELLSSILNIKNIKGSYNIKDEELSNKFNITLNELSEISAVLGRNVSTTLNLQGQTKLKKNKLELFSLNGDAFGGSVKTELKGDSLKAKLDKIKAQDIFVLAGIAPLASADISADISSDSMNLDKLNADAKVNIENGRANAQELSKILEKPFANNVAFSANSDVKIQKSIANINAKLDSSLANIESLKGTFDIKNSNLNADAILNLPDLSRLKFLTDRELKGSIQATANVKKSGDKLQANAHSKIFDGELKAVLDDNLLNVKLDKFKVKAMTDMLNYAPFYDGVGNLNANYKLDLQKGNFDILIDNGQLIQTGFTSLFQGVTGKDITKEVYRDSVVKGTINKGIIDFNANMSAPKSDIKVAKGIINSINSTLNIPVDFRYEKTDVQIKIAGTTQDPKYSVSSDYIKQKALKQVDRLIEKNLKDDGGAVKGLLKNLF